MINDEKYSIDKYYMLEQITETTSALMEKFKVVSLGVPFIFDDDRIIYILEKDGFNSYKDALKYIEYLLEIPKLEE